MRWKELEILVIAARSRTLSDTAAELGVSLATVSRGITSLEEQFGAQLVIKRRDGLVITSAGQRLVRSADGLENVRDRVLAEAQTLSEGRADGFVAIHATERLAAEFMAPMLASAPRSLKLDLVTTTPPQAFETSDGAIAVQMGRPRQGHLKLQKIGAISFAWAANATIAEPLLNLKKFNGDEQLVVYSSLYDKIPEVSWINETGLQKQVVHTSTSSRTLIEAAKAGVGLALCTRKAASREGLVLLDFPVPTPRDIWMVSRPTPAPNHLKSIKDWLLACFA